MFDEGVLVDGTTILLPDLYRIRFSGQSRADLYHQAVEIGAYVGMARLVAG